MDENLAERKSEIENTIRVLEWDKSLKQINPAKNIKLEKCKTELEDIRSRLSPENAEENEQKL